MLGMEMGVGIPGDTPISNEGTSVDEGEEDNGDEDEDELTIHYNANISEV
jgi:hypothetical protein